MSVAIALSALDAFSRSAESYNRISNRMKTTRYFREQVLRKRPYIRLEWCGYVLSHAVRSETQPDGRIRFWGIIPELNNKALRVVTLEDGETIHNAFPDSNFKL